MNHLVLADNDLFIASRWDGNITSDESGLGLYHSDTRHLSLFTLKPTLWTPEVMGSSADRNYVAAIQLANPVFVDDEGRTILPHTISMRRSRVVSGALVEQIEIQNYNPFPVRIELDIECSADFRDMFDIRGFAPGRRGIVEDPIVNGRTILLTYDGADGVVRSTTIEFDQTPESTEVRLIAAQSDHPEVQYPDQSRSVPSSSAVTPSVCAHFVLTLPGNVPQSITVTVTAGTGREAAPAPALEDAITSLRNAYAKWDDACTTVVTDDEVFNSLLRRSLIDLRVLTWKTPDGLFPVAGMPWFAAPFGRDSIITAFQAIAFNPDLAKGTLRFLARWQGTKLDPWNDEEPGKILHEMRFGEKANLAETPHTRYYGSIDSTPLFVILFCEYMAWTGDLALANELMPNILSAVDWIDKYGDRDRDGYIEYDHNTDRGLHNQGWKDSDDSVAHSNGDLAHGPIALIEVQAYVIDAKRRLSELLRRGAPDRAVRLSHQADELAERVAKDFRLGDGEYAIALDGKKRPVQSVASNMGHLLFGGALRRDEAAKLADRLLEPDLNSGWGIRTLSTTHPRFNPMSYHNGSIWPHDNSLIVYGLKRAGLDGAANAVATGIVEAANTFQNQRLPELYCGFQRDERYVSSPAEYPVSCAPQAWAAGTALLLLRSFLGLQPIDGGLRIRPRLPQFLKEVTVRGLRVGTASVDFDVNSENRVRLGSIRGSLSISVE